VAAVEVVRWLTSPLPMLVTTSSPDMTLTMHTPLFALPAWGTLALSVVVGGLVYAPLLWLLERDNLLAARDLLADALRKDNDDDEDETAAPSPA
jgi:hypothetical protein